MNRKILAISTIAAALLVGCSSNTPEPKQVLKPQTHTILFGEVKVPTTDSQKRRIQASNFIEIDGVKTNTRFRTIVQSGDEFGDDIFGLIYDKNGKPVRAKDGSIKISHDNDFSSLLPIGDKLFMVSHFETAPAAMYNTPNYQDNYL